MSLQTNKITKATVISMIIIIIKSPGASGHSQLVIYKYASVEKALSPFSPNLSGDLVDNPYTIVTIKF